MIDLPIFNTSANFSGIQAEFSSNNTIGVFELFLIILNHFQSY